MTDFLSSLMDQIAANIPSPEADLIGGMFRNPMSQIEILRYGNASAGRGWRIPDSEFDRVADLVPDWPEEENACLVLLPSFPRRCQRLLTAVFPMTAIPTPMFRYDQAWRFEGKDRTRVRSGELGFPRESKLSPTLKWVTLRFVPFTAPISTTHDQAAAVIVAVLLHPYFFRRMGGGDKLGHGVRVGHWTFSLYRASSSHPLAVSLMICRGGEPSDKEGYLVPVLDR